MDTCKPLWVGIQTNLYNGCRRVKNSLHYKELSLWIARVHLDTAAGLHLAVSITPCLPHICATYYIGVALTQIRHAIKI